MTSRVFRVCLMIVCLMKTAKTAPVQVYYQNGVQNGIDDVSITDSNNKMVILQGTRGFWDFVGNWIQGSNWFPLEVNIPDVFASVGDGFTSFTNSIIQRIPFLNQENPTRPRPMTVLLPVELQHKPSVRFDPKNRTRFFIETLQEEILPYP